MVVRVWRAVAEAANAPAYREHLECTVLPQPIARAGIRPCA